MTTTKKLSKKPKPAKPRTLLEADNLDTVNDQIDKIAAASIDLTRAVNDVLGTMSLSEAEEADPSNLQVPDEVARFYAVLYEANKQIEAAAKIGLGFVKSLNGAAFDEETLSIVFKESERRSPQYKDIAYATANDKWLALDALSRSNRSGEITEEEDDFLKRYRTKSGAFDAKRYEQDVKDATEPTKSVSVKITPK